MDDYTKNISESIFSPGVLHNEDKFNSKQQRLNALRHKMRQGQPQGPRYSKSASGARSHTVGNSQLNKFAVQLSEEAKRKQKLRVQLDEIKSNMSQY